MAGMVGFENNEIFDFESLINWPEDDVETTDVSSLQSPANDALAASLSDISQSGLGLAADLGFDPLTTDFPLYDSGYLSPSPTANYSVAPSPQDFRPVVDSLASGDSRSRSLKQKRRDAAIDLHLQRGNNALFYPYTLPTDAAAFPYAPSSSYSPESLQESFVDRSRSATTSFSQATPGSSSGRSEPQSDGPPSGSLELVLDMNMNAATQLPKKQRKRTKAEIDDYTNVRRNGACIKHKKQHKKCNCLDKVASPAITKQKSKNQKLVRRAPVHETSFQTSEQSLAVLQTAPSQSILSSPSLFSSPSVLSPSSGIEWFNFGDSMASISDYQDAQWLALEESLLKDVQTLQERHVVCLSPHCTFRAHSVQELNNHYQVHPNLRRTTNPQDFQIGVQEQYVQQPMPSLQTQPLQTLATHRPLDSRLAASLLSSSSQLSSSASSSRDSSTSSWESSSANSSSGLFTSSSENLSADSQALSGSSRATVHQAIASNSSRGVNGAFPRPPVVQRVPSDRLPVDSVSNDDPGVMHPQPAGMFTPTVAPWQAEAAYGEPFYSVGDDEPGVMHRQPAGWYSQIVASRHTGAVYGVLRDSGFGANIIQPREEPASNIGNIIGQDGRLLESNPRANGHLRREKALSWHTSVDTCLMRSYPSTYPSTYQLTSEDFGAVLTTLAAMQMLVAIFSSAIRIMQNLSVASRQLLSFASSFAVGQGPSTRAMMQMV